MESGFEGTLVKSITQGLTETLGEETARIINFFLDPSVASKEPTRYTTLLEKMLSDEPVLEKLIEERIGEKLCSYASIPFEKGNGNRLWHYIQAAKENGKA